MNNSGHGINNSGFGIPNNFQFNWPPPGRQDQSSASVRRRPNHVWAQVAEEREIESAAQAFDVVSIVDKFIIQRGPESYIVGNKRKRERAEPSTDNDNDNHDSDGTKAKRAKISSTSNELSEIPEYESDSSISSNGLSDDSSKDLKWRVQRKKAARKVEKTNLPKNSGMKCSLPPVKRVGKSMFDISDESDDEQETTDKLPKLSKANENESVADSEPEEGQIEQEDLNMNTEVAVKKRTSREIMEEELADLEDWKAAHYIAKRLNEQKKKLIVNTMKLLGREMTLHLFWKTLKIERIGGLMIKNQSRRRTPGGVFLYLLRLDRRFDQAKVREIFKEDREERKCDKKVSRLEKDQKNFTHLSRLIQKRRKQRKSHRVGAAPQMTKTMAQEEQNTDSEEEELEDSYQLPSTTSEPKLHDNMITQVSSAVHESSNNLGSEVKTIAQPDIGHSKPRQLLTYGGDDDYLDITCETEEFF